MKVLKDSNQYSRLMRASAGVLPIELRTSNPKISITIQQSQNKNPPIPAISKNPLIIAKNIQ